MLLIRPDEGAANTVKSGLLYQFNLHSDFDLIVPLLSCLYSSTNALCYKSVFLG